MDHFINQLESIADPKKLLPIDSDERRTVLIMLDLLISNKGIIMKLLEGKIAFEASEVVNKLEKGMDGAIENYYKLGKMNSLIEFKETIEKLLEEEKDVE